MGRRVCVMFDGGFAKKQLRKRLQRDPHSGDVCEIVSFVLRSCGGHLLRAYWYDADPYAKTETHPMTGERIAFGSTPQAVAGKKLVQDIELQPHFAVRRGQFLMHGWQLSQRATKRVAKARGGPAIEAEDVKPHFQQKGVDMRIGLDIARVAFRRTADVIALVTADSDFIPAMKLARTEGLIVALYTMGFGCTRELKVHADLLISDGDVP